MRRPRLPNSNEMQSAHSLQRLVSWLVEYTLDTKPLL